MKRLLVDPGLTDLERSLLASVELDVPPPRAIEKLRAALDDQSELAGVVAVPSLEEVRATKRIRVASLAGVAVMAASVMLVLYARDRARRLELDATVHDPSVVTPQTAALAPVAPLPPEAETAFKPLDPAPSMVASASPVVRVAPKTSVAELPPAPAPKPASLADGLSAAGGGGGGGSGQVAADGTAFDKGAAAGALGKVDVQSCKSADGPTGAGHVTVTFSADGSVQGVVLDSGPHAGTEVGACVAARFHAVHVPRFSSGPARVGKSFLIK